MQGAAELCRHPATLGGEGEQEHGQTLLLFPLDRRDCEDGHLPELRAPAGMLRWDMLDPRAGVGGCPGVAQAQVTRLGRRPQRPLRHRSAGPCRRPGQPPSGADMGKAVQSGDGPLSPGKPSLGEAPAHCGGSHAQDMALWTQQQLPWEDIRYFYFTALMASIDKRLNSMSPPLAFLQMDQMLSSVCALTSVTVSQAPETGCLSWNTRQATRQRHHPSWSWGVFPHKCCRTSPFLQQASSEETSCSRRI